MTTLELRRAFLDYFAERSHLIRPSVPLLTDDPTTLFTSAGMQPYIPAFCGLEDPPAPRVASCQKCMRETDLENVGRTARHATFFEMLGNFSFGDYFKQGAVDYAWEFVTEVLGLPAERLWATVYVDDDEAEELWIKRTAIPQERIVRLGRSDNWWPKERWDGPCGPCSELYLDRGPEAAYTIGFGEKVPCRNPDCKPGCECDRYYEFWNLVFQQYTEAENGDLTPLPQPGIDTGMGLERLAMIVQDVETLYDTDEYQQIIGTIVRVASEVGDDAAVRYGADVVRDTAFKIIADHVRGLSFLMADGAMPGNEGRGYVLRRLLRRAYRQARALGVRQPFLYRVVPAVTEAMGQTYPELAARQDLTVRIVQKEEERFQQTLDHALQRFENLAEELAAQGETVIPGERAFELQDTYGLPLDITLELAGERGLTVDRGGFAAALEAQRERSRAAVVGLGSHGDLAELAHLPRTEFVGYDTLLAEAEVLAVVKADRTVGEAGSDEEVGVVLNRTPCYAERGGQVGDTGAIVGDEMRAAVLNTVPLGEHTVLHECRVSEGTLRPGLRVQVSVDEGRRRDIMRNHTATHLLHAALHRVLGPHALQSGSLVEPDRLRFDFSHYEAVRPEQLEAIEDLANEWVLADLPVEPEVTALEEAKERGAIALFGEKYGEQVRMLRIGEISLELCGGTHVSRTGEIGSIRIVSEGSVSSGTRRLEAVSGRGALRLSRQQAQMIGRAAAELSCAPEDLAERIQLQRAELAELRKRIQAAQQARASSSAADLAEQAQAVGEAQLVAAEVAGLDGDALRAAADRLAEKLEKGVVVLASVSDGKVLLVCKVDPALVPRGAHAGKLIGEVAKACDGGGGGKPQFAQAGGKNPAKVPVALGQAARVLAEQLAAQ